MHRWALALRAALETFGMEIKSISERWKQASRQYRGAETNHRAAPSCCGDSAATAGYQQHGDRQPTPLLPHAESQCLQHFLEEAAPSFAAGLGFAASFSGVGFQRCLTG